MKTVQIMCVSERNRGRERGGERGDERERGEKRESGHVCEKEGKREECVCVCLYTYTHITKVMNKDLMINMKDCDVSTEKKWPKELTRMLSTAVIFFLRDADTLFCQKKAKLSFLKEEERKIISQKK